MNRKFVVTILAYGAALGIGLCAVADVARANDANISKVLGSINVAEGEHVGNVSTVNGSIHISSDATVGRVTAVNGGVHLDSRATASDLHTTNGGIDVQEDGHVAGNIYTVNGGLHIHDGADVAGDVTTVNGGIRVAGAHVRGSIGTTHGGIDLGPNAHIDGNVTMERNQGSDFDSERLPRVVIEPGTVVKGTLRFERKVLLYVSDRATIGAVEGAQPITFSGDNPPQD
jgi:DUF4097 and DUF4098 domain-containing protein YvlB